MNPVKVPRANINEVLAFLKSRGVVLSDEAVKLLREKLDEEPVSRNSINRARELTKNPIFKDVLDRTFVKRNNDLKKIEDSNPLLKAIGEKKRALSDQNSSGDEQAPMPEWLRTVFYDDSRWQPYMTYLGIPKDGQIVKVIEDNAPDMPYIGYISKSLDGETMTTTRRKIRLDMLSGYKLMRLKSGLFQYETDEVNKLEEGYRSYILQHH